MKKNININHTYQKGQALVTLLFFVIIGITVITAAVSIVLTNSIAGSNLEQGIGALNVAESGVENALLRLDRDPTYTGETLSVGTGTATITVSGAGPVTILSVGKYYNSIRKIQAVATKSNYAFTVTSWKEVY